MVFLLYGSDTSRLRTHLEKIVEAFKKKRDPQGLNVAYFDGANSTVGDLLTQIRTMPFLAEKRLLIITGALEHYTATEQLTILEQLREGVYAHTCALVFSERKDDFKKNDLFDFLKPQAYSMAFPLLKEYEREAWVKEYCTRQNRSITTGAARLIAEHCRETSHTALITEQALHLAGKTEVQRAHVVPFLETSIKETIWALTDAIGAGNAPKALELIDEQMRAGENELYLVSMFARQLRIMLQLHGQPSTKANALQETFSLHPFVIKKTLPLTARFSKKQLTEVFAAIQKLEQQLKSTSIPPNSLMSNFVAACLTTSAEPAKRNASG